MFKKLQLNKLCSNFTSFVTLFCRDSNDQHLKFYKKLSEQKNFWVLFFKDIKLIDFHFINAYDLKLKLISIKRFKEKSNDISYNNTLSKNFIETVKKYYQWKIKEGLN